MLLPTAMFKAGERPVGLDGRQPWWADVANDMPLEGDIDASTAMRLADHEFTAVEKPVTVEGEVVPGHKAIARDDTGEVLAIRKSSYVVVQHREMYDFQADLFDNGGLTYETGGVFGNGRVGWILARFPQSIRINGDSSETIPYFMTWNAVDGSRSFGAGPTGVRVICGNTFNMAVRGMTNKISLRHTASIGDRIGQARKALGVVFEYFETYETVMNDLAAKDMSSKAFEAFVEKLLPNRKGEGDTPVRTENQRDTLRALWANSPTLEGVTNTQYRALQAVTEFVDHERSYRNTDVNDASENRALSLFDGQGAALKDRALALLR